MLGVKPVRHGTAIVGQGEVRADPIHLARIARYRLCGTAPREWPRNELSRRRPIFPGSCPPSIFGAGELNFRVRDGNGCGLSARVTRIFCVWMCFDSGPSRAGASGARGAEDEISDLANCPDRSSRSQPLTPGQLLKRSSPRPLVPLSFIRHRTSTCGLSNRWSPCGLTRLTRWGTSSRGELRT